jgi:hypothetical protein
LPCFDTTVRAALPVFGGDFTPDLVSSSHAKKIAPETKVEIARLTRQPWYDCNQLACRAALEMRNRAARERLQAALAGSEALTVLSARHTIGQPTH